jgi:two-component system sensor histidine kinase HydH
VLVLEFLSETVQDVRRESQRILLFGGGLILALLLLLTVFGVVMKRLSRLEEERQKQEQLAVLGEMSAVLAHEIRNPLTSLKGQAQLLEEFLPEDSKLKTKASKVVQEALRLEQLSSQLLDFVKTGVLETASVELKSLFDEVLVSFEEQQVSLSLELATQQWRLDPVKLRQVLTNLLNNAVQASPEKGTVSIRVFEKASSLHIRVEDRGEGIPEENLVSIFTPFVTTRVQGTGLGLPVARRLVELHQGTLSASNREQGGASFEIVLPRN